MTSWTSPGLAGLPKRSSSSSADDLLGIAAPLAPVLSLGRSGARVGLAVGAAIALFTHGTASARAMSSLIEMQRGSQEIRALAKDWMDQVYEIDQPDKPKEQPPPPPPPPPEPEAVKEKEIVKEKDVQKKDDDPYEDEKPKQAPAAAPSVLVAKDDDAPRDDTSGGFANGKDDGANSGFVAADGKGKKPVNDPRASTKGVEKGGGNGAGAPAAAGPDKSSPPSLVGGTGWSCPFPAEAEEEGIDSAAVTLFVTVRPDGTAASVSVTADPGNGFGRVAKQCALTRKYKAGTDREGNASTATLGPIVVRFSR